MSSYLLSLPYFSSSIVLTLLRLIIFSKFQSCLVSSLSPIQEFNFHLYWFCLQFIQQSEMVVLVLQFACFDLPSLWSDFACFVKHTRVFWWIPSIALNTCRKFPVSLVLFSSRQGSSSLTRCVPSFAPCSVCVQAPWSFFGVVDGELG